MLAFWTLFLKFIQELFNEKAAVAIYVIKPRQTEFLILAFYYMTQSILRCVPQTKLLWSGKIMLT